MPSDNTLDPAAPSLSSLLSFREDVHIETDPANDTVVIYSRWEETTLHAPSPAVLQALKRMSLGPTPLSNVISHESDARELDDVLEGLKHIVVRSFGQDAAAPMISAVPLTPQARFEPVQALVASVRLSRFALIGTDGNTFAIESPLSLFRVVIHSQSVMPLIGQLMRAVAPEEMSANSQAVVSFLMAAGMVVQATGGSDPLQRATFAEDEDPALAGWNPSDLMFHTRSTLGRHDRDFGAMYPMGEQAGVEPVVKPVDDAKIIDLPRPAWPDLLAQDPALTTAIEGARRTRSYSDQPMDLEELGELLYRSSRVRSLVGSPDPASTTAGSDRPYLGSGHRYELETYAVIERCTGLERSVYHYDPLGHRLEALGTSAQEVGELLDMGQVEGTLDVSCAVMLVITARFRRLSWKFDGPSYALVLKDAGALSQISSLICASMGLAADALDSINIEASARILGVDWRTECAVAALALGHPDPTAAPAATQRYDVNDASWVGRARSALSRFRG